MSDDPKNSAAPKRRGRKPGQLNAVSGTAKQEFEQVYNMLGGRQALAAWVKRSPKGREIFYKLYSKLLPLQGSGENGEHEIVLSWAEPKQDAPQTGE